MEDEKKPAQIILDALVGVRVGVSLQKDGCKDAYVVGVLDAVDCSYIVESHNRECWVEFGWSEVCDINLRKYLPILIVEL